MTESHCLVISLSSPVFPEAPKTCEAHISAHLHLSQPFSSLLRRQFVVYKWLGHKHVLLQAQ